MEKYLAQLIEDLRAKHKPPAEPTPPTFGDDFDPDELFEDVERYMSGAYEQRIGDVLDLFPEQFPPAERLSPQQMLQLVQAYHDLLFSWNISTDLPEGLSIQTAYRLLVSTLEREVYLSEDGFVTIEFCTYDSENCPYAEVCRCDEEYEEMKKSMKKDDEDDDMPF